MLGDRGGEEGEGRSSRWRRREEGDENVGGRERVERFSDRVRWE